VWISGWPKPVPLYLVASTVYQYAKWWWGRGQGRLYVGHNLRHPVLLGYPTVDELTSVSLQDSCSDTFRAFRQFQSSRCTEVLRTEHSLFLDIPFHPHVIWRSRSVPFSPCMCLSLNKLHILFSCCYSCRWGEICLWIAASKGHIVHPPHDILRAVAWYWQINRRTRRKAYPSATLSTTNPRWRDLGFWGVRPAINHLGHGTAFF
jgi:hypothetical protein